MQGKCPLMVSDVAAVAAAAAASFGAALGLVWLAKRAGLTDVQRDLRTEAHLLAEALKDRVDLLEAENASLKMEVETLERRYGRLERENQKLRERIDKLEGTDA
jgi:predicted nuclease with TOPRIM domain